MRLPRASLVRRLTVGFVLGHTIALFVFFVAILPLSREDETDQIGPGVALAMLREDVVESPAGLALRPGNSFEPFARTTPGAWFVARKAGRTLRWGPVPAEADRVLAALPPVTIIADFGNIGATGRTGDMEVARPDADPNSLLLAAGGVRPEAVTFGYWLGYLHRELYTLVPIGSALFSLIGALIAIPLVLRSVRPTVRAAAALDPTNPAQRLPERRVVKELLPMVRAFNGALERLEQGFERRRRFIADVAHELRTPLAILTMHIDALPAGGRRTDLQRTTFRLGQMVGQMLDSERLALAARQREPVDLVALSRTAVAEIAPLAVASGYELEFSAEAEPVIVEADPHALLRALLNLLGNAIAHGGNAGTITVRVSREGRVDVADQGPGVPADARERIFEPFRRERWDKDGCGLGLHLVREIMHAHGGEVRLVGSGPGALFRLDFAPGR
jgi:signal transduction histidine kinase